MGFGRPHLCTIDDIMIAIAHCGCFQRSEVGPGIGFRISLAPPCVAREDIGQIQRRSEEHTSELQSLMRISYAVFCLKKNNRASVIHCNIHPVSLHTTHTLLNIEYTCTN